MGIHIIRSKRNARHGAAADCLLGGLALAAAELHKFLYGGAVLYPEVLGLSYSSARYGYYSLIQGLAEFNRLAYRICGCDVLNDDSAVCRQLHPASAPTPICSRASVNLIFSIPL